MLDLNSDSRGRDLLELMKMKLERRKSSEMLKKGLAVCDPWWEDPRYQVAVIMNTASSPLVIRPSTKLEG